MNIIDRAHLPTDGDTQKEMMALTRWDVGHVQDSGYDSFTYEYNFVDGGFP